ncbi:peptidase family C69-domain-containing protein [Xylariomycetidae sp. FL0641]|nr:peptidase family C69-domain-containing protein [Xylariomycetidae sp. FL0641]
MTPRNQSGPQYSDLARLVLERAGSAREGVQIVGDLIRRYGHTTYGGNTHLIADAAEGWVVWEFAGGRGLWAAERLGPADVRVLYPGYIERFPVDFAAHPDDYMGSPHLVAFAEAQGWWSADAGEDFDVFRVYGDAAGGKSARRGGFKYMSPAALEAATRAMAPVREADLMARVRDPRISDDQAGYGQVVSLPADLASPADLLRIWVAPTSSLAAPYLPYWLGITAVPPEYGQHRYLTAGAGSSFLAPDFQLREATRFAGRLFKRALYYACAAPATLLPVVTELLAGFEAQSAADLGWVEAGARALLERGERDAARALLTHYSHARAGQALEIGRSLVDALDSYVKLVPGLWRDPAGSQINDPGNGDETVNCLVGYDPDKPPNQQKPSEQKRLFRR